MNTDLVKNHSKWKDTLTKHIQFSIRKRSANRKHFELEKSSQLYKALEYQYQIGLETISENLPEIKVIISFQAAKDSISTGIWGS